MTPRGTSSRLWDRTVDLVLLAAEHRLSRADFAARWRTTPRTVSNVVDHARRTYLVDIETGPRSDGSPYCLRSAGVLSMPALRAMARRR